MTPRQHTKHMERIRNVLLILIAVGSVAFFFTLDFGGDGDSVFSKTAKDKLKFTGDLKYKAYSNDEISRIKKIVKKYNDDIESITISTSRQDAYSKITDETPIIFEANLKMADGATISTPTRRTTRKELVTAILAKLNKDLRAYSKLKKQGKKVKSLVNTM